MKIFILTVAILAVLTIVAESQNQQDPLPKIFEAREVGNMRIGDVGFSYTSSMVVDDEGKCWLWKDFELKDKALPGLIKIERLKQGYQVSILVSKDGSTPKWGRTSIWQGSRKLVPVTKVVVVTNGDLK
jgi:hypothetical protein